MCSHTSTYNQELAEKRQVLADAQQQLTSMTQTCKALEREIDDIRSNSDGKVIRLETENTQLTLQVCMYLHMHMLCVCLHIYMLCMCVCIRIYYVFLCLCMYVQCVRLGLEPAADFAGIYIYI
jgi:hypothetical protein